MWNHLSNEDPSTIRFVNIVTDEYVRSHATTIFNVDTNQEEYIKQDTQNQQNQNQTSHHSQVPSFIPQEPTKTPFINRATSPIPVPQKKDAGTSPLFNLGNDNDDDDYFSLGSDD